MISVVVATMNRAVALRELSLRSLLRQNYRDFEVIVWDASDSDESELVCKNFSGKFEERGSALHYRKAPRRGLASQRNDAARTANGDLVFFIDDDCEVSIDALYSLALCFESFPWLNGAGLCMLNKTPASGNSALKQFAARLFGLKNYQLKRRISKSGGLSLPVKDLPGPAEWLSGGSMAYKKYVFDKLSFDERLEIFGGYATGEDYDFSHRVVLEFGEPHLIADGGYVVHHAAPGGRIRGRERVASFFFNAALIRGNFKAYGATFNPLSVAWGSLATFLILMVSGANFREIIAGYRLAARQSKALRTKKAD